MTITEPFNFRILAKCLVVGTQLLALTACSTNKPAKPAETSQIQPQQQMAAATRQPKTAASNSGSSLDANREGKAPATGPLKDIYFEFDQYNLRADARDLLKTHSTWLKNNLSAQVEIEGHCDERGTGEYNLALGAKRAQAAKDYLVTLGIPAGRISTVSYGKELPVCQDHSEECWLKNRHDRFVVKNLPTA
jgi:peptidoglycan-associated lipoprotein